MEDEDELYAERLRRKAQAEAVAAGQAQRTEQLDDRVRVKLGLAWEDVLEDVALAEHAHELANQIAHRTLRSIGVALQPSDMLPRKLREDPYSLRSRLIKTSEQYESEQLLSLLEAEHEVLKQLAAQPVGGSGYPGADHRFEKLTTAPEAFRSKVNQILEADIVALYLHHNSRLVEVESHEMHEAVVAPTLYLLHSQPQFAAAETAYQKALAEIRERDAGDAITDAATALQEVLTALGCKGGALGDLLKSAKNKGLVKGNDTPLTEAIWKTVDWVAAKRNQGEAHRGDPNIDMSDAWMVVHVVGALIIRLAEQNGV